MLEGQSGRVVQFLHYPIHKRLYSQMLATCVKNYSRRANTTCMFSRKLFASSHSTNHYETLRIKPSASTNEIKHAFINLCKECHPDVNNSPKAAEQFRNVREAYRVLANANSKTSYDFEIGNVSSDSYSSDRFQNRSSKQTNSRQPGDHIAERAVKQRWSEDLIKKQKKQKMTEHMEHLHRDPLDIDSTKYKEWEKRFSERVDDFDRRYSKKPFVYFIFTVGFGALSCAWILLGYNLSKRK